MSPASSTPSSILFPVSEPSPTSNVRPVPQIPEQHLSFRRMSLPTTPSKQHRESMISVASFVSMPEDREAQIRSTPAVFRNVHFAGNGTNHTSTTNSPRRRQRSHVPEKPVDDVKWLKRRKVIEEFYDTEKTYMEGLELIYSHFLTPVIASLNTSEPLLDRSSLTSIFSNFIDIWNLHRSFFSSLTILLTSVVPSPASTDNHYPDPPPSLSQLLLSHFPYLALYNPFVTAFPTAISSLTDLITFPTSTRPNPQYSAVFTTYLARQESDPRCGKLKLRDWLLTIVQRCPRYLLLLKDLIACTDEKDPEFTHLMQVQALVSKITLSLNTSLHTHAQTLALLSLQRATPSLPFQLILPGRTLLKRGSLLQIERSDGPRERQFLLFSDCLIWLAGEEAERAQWKGDWGIGRSAWCSGLTVSGSAVNKLMSTLETSSFSDRRQSMQRSRNKSEDEIPSVKVQDGRMGTDKQKTSPSTPMRPAGRDGFRKSYHPPPGMISRRNASSSGDERWIYKGRAELVDLEVVVTPGRGEGEDRRFEILSPKESFVLYSGTGEDRDEWCSEIRQAKAQLLSSLNLMHPNSTLTSSSSTNHLRRSLQALPFPPTDKRMMTYCAGKSDGKQSKGKEKENAELFQGRRKVEHWVPVIWIPDEKTSECMRCGKSFGWRRRRHHCRLCGRCVCASCSGRTFFISDPQAKNDADKPARACDACYEVVFPLIDPVPGTLPDATGAIQQQDIDTSLDFSSLPSWLSVPSLDVTTTPQALMAIQREPSSPRRYFQDLPKYDESENYKRSKAQPLQTARTRSCKQLLEDFEQNKHGRFDVPNSPFEEPADRRVNGSGYDGDLDRQLSRISRNGEALPPRKEDTARRHKRFSLPAMALQTTNVTARTSAVFDDDDLTEDGGVSLIKVNKRFSLVLGGVHHGNSGMQGQSQASMKPGDPASAAGTEPELVKSFAAGKLGEILARERE